MTDPFYILPNLSFVIILLVNATNITILCSLCILDQINQKTIIIPVAIWVLSWISLCWFSVSELQAEVQNNNLHVFV
jgi:hypothetical protein